MFGSEGRCLAKKEINMSDVPFFLHFQNKQKTNKQKQNNMGQCRKKILEFHLYLNNMIPGLDRTEKTIALLETKIYGLQKCSP